MIKQKEIKWEDVYRLLNSWHFLTIGDAEDWLGISKRKLLLYIEQGIVRPQTPSPGSGIRRKFALIDLVLFSLFYRLEGLGIAPRYMRSVSGDVSKIVRAPVNEGESRPALLYFEKDEAPDTLRVGVKQGDLSKNYGVVIINLGQLQFDVLSAYFVHAPRTKEAEDLFSALGVLTDKEIVTQVMQEVAVPQHGDSI